MAGDRTARIGRPQGVVLWAPIAALLAIGLITTLIDLSGLATKETAKANAGRQRFVVNPGSGEVSLGTSGKTAGSDDQSQFDVGTAEEAAAAPAPQPAAAAESPAPTPDVPVVTAPAEAPVAVVEPEPPSTMPALPKEPANTALTEPSRTKDSLVSAPAPEVTETFEGMQLPKRGDKDVLPSKLYAAPFTRKPEQIVISFVVMDAGLDLQVIGQLVNMPKEITVAYTPYAHKEVSYSEQLRTLGHEVWTMLPMMNDRYPTDDPGPMGLISRMPDEELVRRLRLVLGAVQGSVGVILPPDEAVSVQKNSLTGVLSEINKRGLLMLSTHPSRSVDQISNDKEINKVLHRADLVLDAEPGEAQIRSKLAGLLEAAKEKGEFLVVLNARPQSLAILSEWLKEKPLPAPYVLAPLSALYQTEAAAEPKEEAADDGHGGGAKKKDKPKPPPPKKQKVLPQDKYKQPPAGEKSGGGHH